MVKRTYHNVRILFVIILLLRVSVAFHKLEGHLSVLGVVPPAHGHAYPVISLLNEMVERGHEASLLAISCSEHFTIEIPASIRVVKIEIDKEICSRYFGNNDDLPLLKALDVFSSTLSAFNGVPVIKSMLSFLESNKVDVIICGIFTQFAISVANHSNIPAVVVKHVIDEEVQVPSYIPPIFSSQTLPVGFFSRVLNVCRREMMEVLRGILFAFFLDPQIIEAGIIPNHQPCLAIITSEFGLVTPRDIPPYIKVIGPLLTTTRQTPDEKITKILDEAENIGKTVVYMSFGTIFALSPTQLDKLVSMLSRIDNVLFLWAISKQSHLQTLPKNLPDHVLVFKHPPQLQILTHPAVKLFISHCGANSGLEAVWAGKPVLGIPIFGDQLGVSARLVDYGMAERIEKDFELEQLYNLTLHMLNSQIYTINAKKMSNLVTSAGGLQEAAFHIERVALLGSIEMFVPERMKVAWYVRYYNVDMLVVGLVVGFILVKFCRFISPKVCCCTRICEKKKKKKKKKK